VEGLIEWQICVPKLFDVVRDVGFLFSTLVFKGFVPARPFWKAVELFARAFHEFSQRDDRDGQPMALVVMQMVAERSMYLRIPLRRIEPDT
jgi:hypothetical protein